MKKGMVGFFICMGIMSTFGSKDRDFDDVVNDRVNAKIHYITDSIKAQVALKDSQIKRNRDTIIPAIKATVAENKRLKEQHSIDSAIIAFYREETEKMPSLMKK